MPSSHSVRRRLTELGLEWVARRVRLDRAPRDAMAEASGSRSIPTLVDGETVVHGADEIVAHLGGHHAERPDADRLPRSCASLGRRVAQHGTGKTTDR